MIFSFVTLLNSATSACTESNKAWPSNIRSFIFFSNAVFVGMHIDDDEDVVVITGATAVAAAGSVADSLLKWKRKRNHS